MTSVLYIWAICLRMICMSGMPSSPLPFAGVGLEMLSFALGLDLFHAAKADSKEYFSLVVGKVMSARGSKNLPLLLGSKISILQLDLFFVCVSIISLILSCLSW